MMRRLWGEHPHQEWLVGLGPRHWHALMASFWAADHASWPQCLWLSLTKGKEGWFYLQTVKSNLCWVHLEGDPAAGAGAKLRGAEGLSSTRHEKNSSSVLLRRVPVLLPNFSAFGFLQEKILATSLTKISISFSKRTLNSSPEWLVWNLPHFAKRKTAF